jgi:hypothetical protein
VDNTVFVFGGYDGMAVCFFPLFVATANSASPSLTVLGSTRLNDFHRFVFSDELSHCDIPSTTLVNDLRGFVNDESCSDIVFVVEGIHVYAHKILCLRCLYFRAMFAGEMRESRAQEVVIPDVRHSIFLALLEYLYTDDAAEVQLDMAMELFEAADKFGVERLKAICEHRLLQSINIDNAAGLFHAADQHNALGLREKCVAFILDHFDAVTKTKCFEEMGRTNVELVFEILQRR